MKVAFLEDVPRVAKAGETKEVADGYARNFLIPRKLAVPASRRTISAIEAERLIREKKQARIESELAEMARNLNGKEITLEVKVGARDRLYGSITSADIAAELERDTGFAIDKRKVELPEPIRELGSREVTLKLGNNISFTINVIVREKETD